MYLGFQSIEELEDALRTQPESFWLERGEKRALELFHAAAERVPAYKDFLAKNTIDHTKIQTMPDFKSVPTVDKNNYIGAYSREQLCWDGKFKESQWTISATSGSTGEPFYFPRNNTQILQYALTAELFLRSNFDVANKSTLYIIGFPMGVWIGGVFSYQAVHTVVGRSKCPLSIITPGINKAEILKAVQNLGKEFDQIIIGSYGPFLKDVVDDGLNKGVNWNDYKLGVIFAAEGFSEEFRDYIVEKMGLANEYKDTLNIYGTVDLGTMAHETPLSVLIRRLAVNNKDLFSELFGDIFKLPTLTQFIPEMFYFEDVGDDLICTADSGYPLVRYDLKDHGGVIKLEDVKKKVTASGVDLKDVCAKGNINSTLWNLPFVHVYERSDFSVSFFAFQVYPETVRKAIQDPSIAESITGKFTMMVKYDEQKNQYLEINVELKQNITETDLIKELVRDLVMNRLLQESSEYRKTTEEFPGKTIPKIVFWPYEDPTYFRPGTKQKWVSKG
ncbi:MAG: hypothetical protein A3A61_02430 [Candidatus Woykebacteria bacterium RIFCSPLOWO2_01_FULL_43_14]|uniref:Phenylacetate--CoA ligase n=2 Tax=Candidatus Woykeibacteriota TaxID=1817899 RepID=A0A1G1WWV8_9BACT|nr:MAG: hypothetical protein A3J50_01440 [Candidatus Woykebacteria bacterium RIFCSPHIGHO2_02_FULL_43_16b]OGY31830.1 MAG: hypothetical protein A3A61_02430 [Candidatus Woykebacteria bacterium RIFCSPLOWO2_01_FULL_43_14]